MEVELLDHICKHEEDCVPRHAFSDALPLAVGEWLEPLILSDACDTYDTLQQ